MITRRKVARYGGRSVRRPLVAVSISLALIAVSCGGEEVSGPDASNVDTTDAAEATESTEASGSSTEEVGFPLTVSDCGRDLEFTESPESVLTVGVSAVALLEAAGASDHIVGRTGEFGAALPDDLDAAVGEVEVIDDFDPALEAIVDADPDLVLGYGLFNTEASDVEAAGPLALTVTGECGDAALPADKADVGNFAVMVDDVRTYGQIFETESEANAEADDLESRIEAVKSDPPVTEITRAAGVYFFGEQLSVTGQYNMLHEQMATLGLTDVNEDLEEGFAEVSIESLLEDDPDLIILSYGFDGDDFETAKANLLAQPGADTLQAVIDDRIVGLPASMRGPDPGAVDGLELLAEELAN